MRIEIDTNQMSRLDEDMILDLANRINEDRGGKQKQEKTPKDKTEEKDTNSEAEEKHEPVAKAGSEDWRDGKFYFPAKRGEPEYAIKVVISKLNGADEKTIAERTQLSHGTVYAALSTLNKKGELEKSNTRPIIYYLKGENAELKQQLKHAKGKKFSNF